MAEQSEKEYTYDELKVHKDAKSAWVSIHDQVYDVTKFLEEVRQHLCNNHNKPSISDLLNQLLRVPTAESP